jgi:oligopeptidase B
MILSVVALARYLVRLERENANPRIVLREFATGREESIAFEEEAYSLGFSAGY